LSDKLPGAPGQTGETNPKTRSVSISFSSFPSKRFMDRLMTKGARRSEGAVPNKVVSNIKQSLSSSTYLSKRGDHDERSRPKSIWQKYK